MLDQENVDQIANAVVKQLMSDPEIIMGIFSNLRVNAALAGFMSTAEHFRKLNGLPGAYLCASRFVLYDFCLSRMRDTGLYLEFGVAAGESIRYCASIKPEQKMFGFDSFEGLPEAWHAHPAGEYTQGGVLPSVPDNVELHKGWFNQSLEPFVENHKAEFEADGLKILHLDADIYSSTKYILDTIGQYIRVGTIIMFDEYWNFVTWEHDEYKAWMEYLEANPTVEFEYIAYVPNHCQLAIRITKI